MAVTLAAVWLVWQEMTLSPALAQTSPGGADEVAKVAEELRQLKQVVEKLRDRELTNIFIVSGLSGILAALIGFFSSWLSIRGSARSGRERLRQQLHLAGEKATMKLVGKLGSDSLPVCIASATLLFDRLRQAEGRGVFRRKNRTDHEQARILQVLVSVTKEDTPKLSLAKVIGDEFVSLRKALLKKGRRPKPGTDSPLRSYGGQELDLQHVKLPNVFWPRVDARGIDFFESDFSKAGLRGAFLQGAVFRDANLMDSVLCDADLRGADLRGANLKGADLAGADLRGVKADARTVWPDGFDIRRLSD
jgi:hypothetical protein